MGVRVILLLCLCLWSLSSVHCVDDGYFVRDVSLIDILDCGSRVGYYDGLETYPTHEKHFINTQHFNIRLCALLE